jgi:hypothetical protein
MNSCHFLICQWTLSWEIWEKSDLLCPAIITEVIMKLQACFVFKTDT